MPLDHDIDQLDHFLARHVRLFVLTGAGISTGSGIPDYRDLDGAWKRPAPVQFRDFVRSPRTRQRYWARSLVGWPAFARARPNRCHRALAAWQADGRIGPIVTQNVDRLHQAADTRDVIDLHGRLDRVVCLDCGALSERAELQAALAARNPSFVGLAAEVAPDGDARLDAVDCAGFDVPSCTRCGGLLKPDVVFFGEAIPPATSAGALAALDAADAVLVVGSSLMVYSGYRFCRRAAERGVPVAAISPGRTRADDLLRLKVTAPFETVLDALDRGVSRPRPGAPRRASR